LAERVPQILVDDGNLIADHAYIGGGLGEIGNVDAGSGGGAWVSPAQTS
jgi:hypothetical protein